MGAHARHLGVFTEVDLSSSHRDVRSCRRGRTGEFRRRRTRGGEGLRAFSGRYSRGDVSGLAVPKVDSGRCGKGGVYDFASLCALPSSGLLLGR